MHLSADFMALVVRGYSRVPLRISGNCSCLSVFVTTPRRNHRGVKVRQDFRRHCSDQLFDRFVLEKEESRALQKKVKGTKEEVPEEQQPSPGMFSGWSVKIKPRRPVC